MAATGKQGGGLLDRPTVTPGMDRVYVFNNPPLTSLYVAQQIMPSPRCSYQPTCMATHATDLILSALPGRWGPANGKIGGSACLLKDSSFSSIDLDCLV